VSHGVFSCGCFICTVVYLLLVLEVEPVLGGGFGVTLGGVIYGWWGFSKASKILLGNMVRSSFKQVVCREFCVNVIPLYCVEVCTLVAL
jgi:hypothetical protein